MKSFLVFMSALVIGWILEAIFSQGYYFFAKEHYKEHHFTFGKYIFFMLFPLIAVAVSFLYEPKILQVFFLGCFLGTSFEWVVGWAYEKTIGQRLWTYHRFGILSRYTSLLSIPLWGVAGVLMWYFAKIFIN